MSGRARLALDCPEHIPTSDCKIRHCEERDQKILSANEVGNAAFSQCLRYRVLERFHPRAELLILSERHEQMQMIRHNHESAHVCPVQLGMANESPKRVINVARRQNGPPIKGAGRDKINWRWRKDSIGKAVLCAFYRSGRRRS